MLILPTTTTLRTTASSMSALGNKCSLFAARDQEPVGRAIECLNDSELQRRVEGVIDIVSAVASSSTGETIASLLLSNDPASGNAFVLNASNSSATHVFLVPSNSTAAAASDDGSIPVVVQVPVYSPRKASIVDYCMTYDPNPPASVPLTAQNYTDQVTDHQSQVFAYHSSSGVIEPMWTVPPSSANPSAASYDGASSTALSHLFSLDLGLFDFDLLFGYRFRFVNVLRGACKRSSAADAAAEGAADPVDPDRDDANSCGGRFSLRTSPLVSNAVGILPSTGESAKDMTIFFPPESAATDDGNVGASSAAPAADTTGDEDDGEDGEDDEDGIDASSDDGEGPSAANSAAEDGGAFEDDASAAGVVSVGASADAEETITDDEITPTLASNSPP
ncbi:hypothetical protein FRC01_011268 [Tulasnella sp. 417]|nr:hypothetical protein FRC01_011268 [Tulasnella sp. 417]